MRQWLGGVGSMSALVCVMPGWPATWKPFRDMHCLVTPGLCGGIPLGVTQRGATWRAQDAHFGFPWRSRAFLDYSRARKTF